MSRPPSSPPTRGEGDDEGGAGAVATPTEGGKNAFAMLMAPKSKKRGYVGVPGSSGGSGKKKAPQSTKFVLCPAGCGRHILRHLIHQHLDKCMTEDDQQVQQDPPSTPTALSSPLGEDKDLTTARTIIIGDNKTPFDDSKNAFAHMMKQSAQVFHVSTDGSPKLIQRMHLHDDLTVSVTCYQSAPSATQLDERLGRIAWSSTVQVKSNCVVPVQLLVSSSIPSGGVDLTDNGSTAWLGQSPRPRWVQRHSRLSVPVLKSVLQKSVRRRKPLPSVRVAMELADKSLSDLLRRLSIIAVEDSTVHPDVPLMVWLMMAVSKDFELSSSATTLTLWKRLFSFVFEMASCRWKDPLTGTQPESDSEAASAFSIATFHTKKDDNSNDQGHHRLCTDDTFVWSLLMRSHYGGMKGDVTMLQHAARLWKNRFSSPLGLSEDNRNRLQNATGKGDGRVSDSCLMTWSQIPSFVHASVAKISGDRVEALLGQGNVVGLLRLTLADITTEGIDFHCSSVLESAVLNDTALTMECCDTLKDAKLPSSVPPIPALRALRRSWLEAVLKSCMWKYSAGVNFRLPLLVAAEANSGSGEDVPESDADLKQLWESMICPRTKIFAERYVSDRLSRF